MLTMSTDNLPMADTISTILFIYSDEGKEFEDIIVNNSFNIAVKSVHIDTLRSNPEIYLESRIHVVVSASISAIKSVMEYALHYDFSMGFLPFSDQKSLSKSYSIPTKQDEMIELALKGDLTSVDLVFCNEKILLFKGIIGRVPLIDSIGKASKFRITWEAIKKLSSLRLLPFTFTTYGENEIKTSTAATGCVLLQTPEQSFSSEIVSHENSCTDGMISTLIIAPFSVIDYLRLLWIRLVRTSKTRRLPDSIGHIKCKHISIESESPLNISIDGEDATTTPADILVKPKVLRITMGTNQETIPLNKADTKEHYNISALPAGKELQKAVNKKIPFFTYASEERFKDLFIALRDDARLDSTYVVLMVLSTILATVGLYLNSSSVIIGAMLLAPLMAPIISMAMSLLRFDQNMFKQSAWKIFAGIVLALITSALFTLISPYQPITSEMQGRLNPTVLDLTVAIVAGIAGAYTKSFKEILQSLAGVAIAVALVPPLSVAGVGLGRLDLPFFVQAFLLFSTNLIGIILAATMTFRILGFSPAVQNKRGLTVVFLFLFLISIPLYMAFQGIVERSLFENNWRHERFLVNEKYLIVQHATLNRIFNKKVLTVEIHTREPLNRYDMNIFKQKVKRNFSDDLYIRAKLVYIP